MKTPKGSGSAMPGMPTGEMSDGLQDWLAAAREVEFVAEDSATEAARRQLVLPAVSDAILRAPLEVRRERTRQGFWWAAAAAAILVCGGVGYTLNPEPGPAVALAEPANLRQVIGKVVLTLPSGDNHLVTPDTELTVGEEISTTAQAFASVELGDQTRIDLSSATTVKLMKVRRLDNAFFLRSGRVDINVPKIANEERLLSVRTPDTNISVRGTIFSVEVSERDDRSVTTVRVSRGSVAVQHGGQEHLLRSGELWSSFPAATAAWQSEPRKQAVPAAEPGSESKPLKPGATRGVGANEATSPEQGENHAEDIVNSPSVERPPKVSSLAEQNQLFERGLRARDRGDDKQAIRWFERLMREYPDSPLLPSATAERSLAKKRLSGPAAQ